MNKSLPKTIAQAHPLNSEQQNTQETESSLNFPPFKKYTKNDLEFNVFTPKDGLSYFFLSELIEPNSFILDQKTSTLFNLKNCSDIQRFCYYPGTTNIYTFLGFKTAGQRNHTMKNNGIISSSYEHILTIYPLEEKAPKKERKHQKASKNKKQQQETPTELPKSTNCEDLELSEFEPKNNLVYLFFGEQNKPTSDQIKSQTDKYHGIDYSLDIQKYRYYPGTKKVYTFMGFSNRQLAENAIEVLKNSVLERSVFLYPHQSMIEKKEETKKPSTHHKSMNYDDFYILKYNKISLPKFNEYSKSDLEFTEFKPKENLFYLFLAEKLEPTKSILASNYNQLYKIKKSDDIQRFRFYPRTKNVYTFIGFNKKVSRNYFLYFDGLIEYAVDNKVFIYPYSLNFLELKRPIHRHAKESTTPVKDFVPNNKNKAQNPVSNATKKSADPNISKVVDDSQGPFFEPKSGLYYLRFRETNDNNRNVRYENKKLFGVDNVNDIQRGFRFRDDEDPKDYFTFFGFDTLERRASALEYLQNLRSSVDTSTIKEINDRDYDYEDDIVYVDDYDEDSNSNGFNVRIIDYDDDDEDDDDDEEVDFDDDDDDVDDNEEEFNDDDDDGNK